jgi:hypothetical protein
VGGSAEPKSTEPLPGAEAAAQVASVLKQGLEIWSTQAKTWYERAQDRPRTWTPEDVVGDYTNLIENLTPLVETSINVTLALLRSPAPESQPAPPASS